MRKAVEQEQADGVRGQSWGRDGRQREIVVKGRWRGESPTPRREEHEVGGGHRHGAWESGCTSGDREWERGDGRTIEKKGGMRGRKN